MTPTLEERQAAEILRLYDVQAELVKELAHVRFQLNTEQAGHHLDSVIRRLLSDRWLVWPVRLLWPDRKLSSIDDAREICRLHAAEETA